MDKLDKFNDAIIDLSMNWKTIFYFVAAIFILATILSLGGDSNTALLIISWVIVVLAVVVVEIFSRRKETSPKKFDSVQL